MLKVRSFVVADYPQVRALWVASGLEIRPGDELPGIRRKLEREAASGMTPRGAQNAEIQPGLDR